jgi:hypothetical protein
MFKVGDLGFHLDHGLGELKYIDSNPNESLRFGVVFLKRQRYFHDLDGICKYGYGFYVKEEHVRKVYELNPINKLLYPDYEIFTYNEKKYLKPKEM